MKWQLISTYFYHFVLSTHEFLHTSRNNAEVFPNKSALKPLMLWRDVKLSLFTWFYFIISHLGFQLFLKEDSFLENIGSKDKYFYERRETKYDLFLVTLKTMFNINAINYWKINITWPRLYPFSSFFALQYLLLFLLNAWGL